MRKAISKSKTIVLNEGEERQTRNLIVIRAFELDEWLRKGNFSQTEKQELEEELVLLHGLYMQFTGHGVLLPVSK
ncbi:hypothetical protein [Enterococcus faecium]|uniref:hypothetical protein n=1 Tax=Enterococcus faecium TaxID=1352 RepID=UPI00338DC83E